MNKVTLQQQARLLQTIEQTISSLAYTGLTTISESTFQRLTTCINECSNNQFFRLASAIRVASNELKKSVNGSSKTIDNSKYAFFLNQSWLLAKGLQKALDDKDEFLLERYSGRKSQEDRIPALEVVPIGIEQGLIDRRWLSFRIHFKVMEAPKKKRISNEIITWAHMFDLRGKSAATISVHSPEKYLNMYLKKRKISLADFIQPIKRIRLKNWVFNPGAMSISIKDKSKVKFLEEVTITKDLPIFRSSMFLSRLKSLDITPLDHVFTFSQYLGFPSIRMKNFKATKKRLTCSFSYEGLTFNVDLVNNETYRTLIENFKRRISLSKKVPYLYGMLVMKSSALNFIPLTLAEASADSQKENVTFLTVNSQKLQTLKAQASNVKGLGTMSSEREKNLALLGGLLDNKKKK
ncbi:MAG: hypothetical protein ACE5OZ_10900 [Candidatus Heimdallarchaeota archaeon]